jgi:hypothetical protein
MWAQTMNKHRVPPLADYLLAADPAPPSPAAKVAKMRSALSVLSAQYGIPLRQIAQAAARE